VPASVVRSIARSSLLGGALADRFTSAGPSPRSLLPSCRGISSPRSCCLADPRNFEPALLLFGRPLRFEPILLFDCLNPKPKT
jgi:hypothetical protein